MASTSTGGFVAGDPFDPTSTIFYGVVGVGLVIAADYAPTLVNGLLALVLAGLILRHSDRLSGWFTRGVAATAKK